MAFMMNSENYFGILAPVEIERLQKLLSSGMRHPLTTVASP
jgi:hypothetical protein